MLKRTFDIIGAGAGLAVLSPVLLSVAALVRVKLGSPVLFTQERPGRGERIFTIYKFRTMTNERDDEGNLLPDEERLTDFGQFLRSTSLDEFPELWNVLKGDMSLVGPRPLRVKYLDRYSERQARRHEVRPGITGWAQVNGRNATSWPERLEMDVWYVENRSLWLDVKTLARTVWQVVKREGVSAEGHATMPEFKGQTYEDIQEGHHS